MRNRHQPRVEDKKSFSQRRNSTYSDPEAERGLECPRTFKDQQGEGQSNDV